MKHRLDLKEYQLDADALSVRLRDAMRNKARTMSEQYTVVYFGGEIHLADSQKEAFGIAQEHVDQMIIDHWRDKLPVEVTKEIVDAMCCKIYRLDEKSEIDMPVADWFREFHEDQLAYKKTKEQREYELYLELKKKFEDKEVLV